jgi:hypothetical protein
MALPRSLTQPLRQGQLTVASGWRCFVAPYNRQLQVSSGNSALGPTIYDLLVQNKLIDTTLQPAAGWFDMGYVKNFKFTPQTKRGNVITGYRGAIRAKYMAETGEKVSCTFAEVSHTTVKFATGTQVFNVLKTTVATPSTLGPLSTSGTAAVPIGASGYLPTGGASGPTQGLPTLCVPAGSGANFPAGSYIVCDQDYNGTSFGFVGDAGANVFQGAVTDVDFIRKTSDYVNGVVSVVPTAFSGQDALILTSPFVGGGNAPAGTTPTTSPQTGAKVQGILGYVSREGGSAIEEWSAIFVLDTIDASQLLFYYPRLSPDVFTGIPGTNLQNATAMQTYDLDGSWDSLAFDDPVDGETVVAYRMYIPHPGTSPGI